MMKMASFHLMCSLGSRLPSASSTFSPNLLKNRLFTFERCRSGIGHPGQIKQIIFRQRIKTAIINSPDENVKNTLSIYFNHPDQLPLGMNGFIRFSKHHLKINEENAKDLFDLLENTPMVQEVDQVDPDVKELIDKIFEKEMAYRIKNEPSLIEEQISLRQRLKTAMTNSPDENVKALLQKFYHYAGILPNVREGFVNFSTKNMNIDQENAEKIYDILENTQKIEQVDSDVKEMIDQIFAKAENISLMKENREKPEKPNNRLPKLPSSSRRQLYQSERTIIPSKPSTVWMPLKREQKRLGNEKNIVEERADDLFQQHFNAVDVVFQSMKSIRKSYAAFEEKAIKLENENKKLKLRLETARQENAKVFEEYERLKKETQEKQAKISVDSMIDRVDEHNASETKQETVAQDLEENSNQEILKLKQDLMEMTEQLAKAYSIIESLREEYFKLQEKYMVEKSKK